MKYFKFCCLQDKNPTASDLQIKINGQKQNMWFDFKQMTMTDGANSYKIKKTAVSEGESMW